MRVSSIAFGRLAGYLLPALGLILLLGSFPGQTLAQRASDEEIDERKTRKAPAMSEQVYKRLTEAQELIEAENYQEGLSKLRDLENNDRLSPYERAQVYNYFAYTYFTLERYQDAMQAYQNVLKQPELPYALELNSIYTLAQLHFIQENYQRSIKYINDWFNLTDKPTENAFMLLGQAHYQLENYQESLDALKKAYDIVVKRGDKPKENLLLLIQADYMNMGDFNNVIETARELVVLYPKTDYWLTMAGAYAEMKQHYKQMAIFEMLYEKGDLPRENQRLNLANLYLMHDVPYKAAKVIDEGIEEGLIEAEVRNLRLLSQAWMLAQHNEESIPALRQAARLSDDGELNVRLAQAYLNLDRYQEAVESLREALRKGGLKRRDQTNVMLGMALFELKKYDASIAAFKAAARDDRSRKTARQWMSYATNEKTREEEITRSLENRRR